MVAVSSDKNKLEFLYGKTTMPRSSIFWQWLSKELTSIDLYNTLKDEDIVSAINNNSINNHIGIFAHEIGKKSVLFKDQYLDNLCIQKQEIIYFENCLHFMQKILVKKVSKVGNFENFFDMFNYPVKDGFDNGFEIFLLRLVEIISFCNEIEFYQLYFLKVLAVNSFILILSLMKTSQTNAKIILSTLVSIKIEDYQPYMNISLIKSSTNGRYPPTSGYMLIKKRDKCQHVSTQCFLLFFLLLSLPNNSNTIKPFYKQIFKCEKYNKRELVEIVKGLYLIALKSNDHAVCYMISRASANWQEIILPDHFIAFEQQFINMLQQIWNFNAHTDKTIAALIFLNLLCRNKHIQNYLNLHTLNIKFDDETTAPEASSSVFFILINCIKNNLIEVRNQQIHSLCLATLTYNASNIENISRSASHQILSHLLELFEKLKDPHEKKEEKIVYQALIAQYLMIIVKILARFQLNPYLVIELINFDENLFQNELQNEAKQLNDIIITFVIRLKNEMSRMSIFEIKPIHIVEFVDHTEINETKELKTKFSLISSLRMPIFNKLAWERVNKFGHLGIDSFLSKFA